MAWKSVRIGKRKIDFIHRGSSSSEPMLFLHGFGASPGRYHELSGLLSSSYQLFMPKMYGINCMEMQPSSIDGYLGLTCEFRHRIDELSGSYYAAGHSIGGTIAYMLSSHNDKVARVIGLNPAIPVKYSAPEFGARAFGKTIMQSIGMEGGARGIGFSWPLALEGIVSISRNPRATYSFVSDIASLDYSGTEIRQPALLLFGTDDAFFDYSGPQLENLLSSFRNSQSRIEPLEGMKHDWPVFQPGTAAARMTAFLGGR